MNHQLRLREDGLSGWEASRHGLVQFRGTSLECRLNHLGQRIGVWLLLCRSIQESSRMPASGVAIRSFGRHATRRLTTCSSQQLPPHLASKICHLIEIPSKSRDPADMAFPGTNLHPLHRSHKGPFAVSISAKWRLVFRFRDSDAYDVEVVDYRGK